MINVIVALKLIWANHRVHVRCDNLAVVDVLTSGKAGDSILCTCCQMLPTDLISYLDMFVEGMLF